jgi:hypothetical protein
MLFRAAEAKPMKVARSLFGSLFLSVLVSACAQGAAGNHTPNDPSQNAPYLFSSAAPAPAIVAPPLALVNHDEGSWSNIWTAQAQLKGGSQAER